MKNSIQEQNGWRRVMAVITLLMMSAVVVFGQSKQSESNRKQRLGNIVAEVLSSPRVSTGIDNRAGSPLSIIDSSSLEISGKVYRKLTGQKAPSGKATAFPDITLFNNSDRTVTQALLILSNETSRTRARRMIGGIKIEPHSAYVVDREGWMVSELLRGQPVKDQPNILSQKEIVRYDSGRVWLLGSAADWSITVAMTRQEGGERWDLRQKGKVNVAKSLSGNILRPVAHNTSAPQWCDCSIDGFNCTGGGGWICEGWCYNCTIEGCMNCAIEVCEGRAGWENCPAT